MVQQSVLVVSDTLLQNSNVQIEGNFSVGSVVLTLQNSQIVISGNILLGEHSTLEIDSSMLSTAVQCSGTALLQGMLVLTIDNVDTLDYSVSGQYSQLLIAASNISGKFENISVILHTAVISDCEHYSALVDYTTSFSILITKSSVCGSSGGLVLWQIGLICGLAVLTGMGTAMVVFILRQRGRQKFDKLMREAGKSRL